MGLLLGVVHISELQNLSKFCKLYGENFRLSDFHLLTQATQLFQLIILDPSETEPTKEMTNGGLQA